MSDNNSKYRVESGTHRTADGDLLEPGDVFEPTDHELDVFEHKLEEVDDGDVETDTESESEEESEPDVSTADVDTDEEGNVEDADEDVGPESVDDDRLPNNYPTLQSLASAYPGEEINGRSSATEIKRTLTELSDDDLATLSEAAGVDLENVESTSESEGEEASEESESEGE